MARSTMLGCSIALKFCLSPSCLLPTLLPSHPLAPKFLSLTRLNTPSPLSFHLSRQDPQPFFLAKFCLPPFRMAL